MITRRWLPFLVACILSSGGSAAPYRWEASVSPRLLSPTDTLEIAVDGAQHYRGSSAQGGLVDVRYGQVSLDLGGKSLVLTTNDKTVLTLNGTVVPPETLLEHLPKGLAATARYDQRTGQLGWLDAYGQPGAPPAPSAVHLDIVPWKGPAYRQGERLTISLSTGEKKRLGSTKKPIRVFIPGITHGLPLVEAADGSLQASFTVQPGWNYQDVPILLHTGDSASPGRVYSGPRFSVSTTGPSILGYGPQAASTSLKNIPGWVDHRSESHLIDPSTAELEVSEGCRVLSFTRRVDRSSFELESDGPGDYWIEFRVSDRLGRPVKKRWILRVAP